VRGGGGLSKNGAMPEVLWAGLFKKHMLTEAVENKVLESTTNNDARGNVDRADAKPVQEQGLSQYMPAKYGGLFET